MHRPSKHAHPDQTVLRVATLLIARLKGKRLEEFDSLGKYVGKAVPGGGPLLLPALSLLYLLGLVAYRPKTDSVEYGGLNEAV